MKDTLKQTYDIVIATKTNSFIYNLKRFPILKYLVKNIDYKDAELKSSIRLLILVINAFKTIAMRAFYFAIVAFVALLVSETDFTNSFMTVFTSFTLVGLFLNTKLLTPKQETYYMVILFNVDATYYMKLELIKELVKNFILDFLIMYVMSFLTGFSLPTVLVLSLFTIPTRIIGEALDILAYRRHGTDAKFKSLKLIPIIICLAICYLPFHNLFLSPLIIFTFLIAASIIAIPSLAYLLSVKDYRTMYKKINTLNAVMAEDMGRDDIKIKKKDIEFDSHINKRLRGYDKYNAIFMARHRSILYKSARNFSLVIGGIYLIVIVATLFIKEAREIVGDGLLNLFTFFPLAFYYINRGQLITKAMYYNADVAMLTYNFYRKPKVILGLFRRRVRSLIFINMLPALVIAIGNTILLLIATNVDAITITASFVYVISLTIFFSVHYLVLYYLLQPFTETMTMRKGTYALAIWVTYMACYMLSDIDVNALALSIFGTIFAIVYIIISYILVLKFAPKTFKINS